MVKMIENKQISEIIESLGLKEPVHLTTLDRDLEDIMLGHYTTGKIFEYQHYVDASDPKNKVYIFTYLERDTLLAFLEDYKQTFEYNVYSITGELIIANKIDKEKASLIKFLQIAASVN